MTPGVILGFDIGVEVLIIGAVGGLAYALLGAGLVLVYRATRVLNLAHGEIGALGAVVLAKLVMDHDWNFWLALGVVMVLGGGLGALVEVTVIRRLRRAPELSLLVATIGVAQLAFVGQLLVPRVRVENAGPFPSPLDRTLQIGDLVLTSSHFMILALAPAAIGGLAYYLQRTPWGLAVRAAADNPDAAELAAISTRRISTQVWVVAGVLATVTAVLVNPLRNVNVGGLSAVEALGPGLLLRALVAALVGRLRSLPLTLVGGVGIGVAEALVYANVADPAWSELILFLAVLALLVMRADGGWARRVSADALSTRIRPLAPEVRDRLGPIWRVGMPIALIALAVVAPFVFDSASQTFMLGRVLVFAIVGISVTVVTGWGGQLSLGQFAFVGLGAMVTSYLHARGMGYGAAVSYSVVAAALVALVVGYPALRLRGLFLAVTTLSFAVAGREWLFTRDWFLADGSVVFVQPGTFLGFDFARGRTFYFLCLLVLVAVVAVTGRLRASGPGRSMIAVRDNERAAASVGLSASRSRMLAFVYPATLAGLAGALLAGLTVQFGPDAFGPAESLSVVAMAVIGGLGSITGAVLGALYIIGVPALIGETPAVRLATSGIGVLALLLWQPGGLAQVVFRVRDVLVARFVPTDDQVVVSDPHGEADADSANDDPSPSDTVWPHNGHSAVPIVGPDRELGDESGVAALDVDGVSVVFGGLEALTDISLTVAPGEVVGLIGTNGAGKSTLMDVISGFTRPVGGTVIVGGHDVSGLPPHMRARHGLGRVFQDARLYPGLTVREAVSLALEAADPSDLVPVLVGYAPARSAERRKKKRAEECIDSFGLGRYADVHIAELSTGTRRIVELASLVAQGPDVLLLDEPTAGVAQRETEALIPVIDRVRRELGAAVVLIEHDMPMIMATSDRVICLSAGQVIAEGTPEQVRNDAEVIAAYLGTDDRAIERSQSTRVGSR